MALLQLCEVGKGKRAFLMTFCPAFCRCLVAKGLMKEGVNLHLGLSINGYTAWSFILGKPPIIRIYRAKPLMDTGVLFGFKKLCPVHDMGSIIGLGQGRMSDEVIVFHVGVRSIGVHYFYGGCLLGLEHVFIILIIQTKFKKEH